MQAPEKARLSTYSDVASIPVSLTATLVGSSPPSEKGTPLELDEKPVSSSSSTMSNSDPKAVEIKTFAHVLEKLSDKRLDRQRYVMSGDKTEELGKNALGAKVERALGRRMVGQDAIYKPKKPMNEKRPQTIEAQ